MSEIDRIVEGDWTAVAVARALPEVELEAMAQNHDLPPLKASAVKHVMLALSRGLIAPEVAQSWASFVRWGYFEGLGYPSSDFDIEYEAAAERAIVDAISRMDELGDPIDGEIMPDEFRSLLSALSAVEAGQSDPSAPGGPEGQAH